MDNLPDRETQRIAFYRRAPLAELLAVLIRQFRAPLLRAGVPGEALSDAAAQAAAEAAIARQPNPHADAIRAALPALLAESEHVLAAWGLSFAEALQADMSRIPGWESTAEFLDLAERKANAELRIATGASLLLALGSPSVRAQVQTVIDHAARRGAPDLDSVIAERVLAWAREQGVIR